MNKQITRMTLDVGLRDSYKVVFAKLGDTERRVIADVKDNGEPYDLTGVKTVEVRCRKVDGKQVTKNAVKENNNIIIDINGQMTTCRGTAIVDVVLYGTDGGILSTAKFYLNVDDGAVNDDEIKSNSDYPNVASALRAVGLAKEVADTALSTANTAEEKVEELLEKTVDFEKQGEQIEQIKSETSSLKEDLGDTSNELYKKEEREIAVDSSDYNLLENKVAYIDTNNEVMTYENANAYVMHKNVISGEKYRILSQTHASVNTLLYAICDSNGKVINSAKMGVPINTYIITEITIPSNGVELYLNEFPTQTYPLVVNKIETINISKINGKETVNCWGDSLTRGVGVGDSYSKTFPYVLHGLLDGRKVINCGVGGENTINIASRQGGLPNIVKPFTIPANASKVEIELTNIYGDSTGILLQGGSALDPTTGQYVMTAQINPCSINGVEGTLTHENGKYYFSRSENGESVIVSRPTPLITHAMISLRDNINIIWLGTNGGFTTSAELIENIEAMIDYMTPINKKYIVFGIHHLVSTVTETFETIEKNMAMHFGRHYINQRKYMIEYGLSDAGITPTVEDTTAISQGKIPPSLLYDDVHYNDKGYNIIATLASERGKELGYW